ncbi:MAG: Lrp/AsnC family transcriptional regulator [Pseudomonadales bacterium]|jgi:DNA-binding Lrp family transcriptional regulator|nr:Lrp/AsnC family transcriptional regulator [Pseudomonadales bacterium]MDA0956130.1 Lrp/AsnC family transcriptional regulator [Pseudomonadota bacterium]
MELLPLDRIDRRMLEALQEDGRLANSALARRIGLSESATLRRLRRLEDSGLIEGYVLLVNQAKAGKPGNIFVEIALTAQEEAALTAFETAVLERPEILECYLMSGEYDYLLRVVVADFADFERIHREHLTRLPHVGRVRSSFTLRTVLRRTSIPL